MSVLSRCSGEIFHIPILSEQVQEGSLGVALFPHGRIYNVGLSQEQISVIVFIAPRFYFM